MIHGHEIKYRKFDCIVYFINEKMDEEPHLKKIDAQTYKKIKQKKNWYI